MAGSSQVFHLHTQKFHIYSWRLNLKRSYSVMAVEHGNKYYSNIEKTFHIKNQFLLAQNSPFDKK